MRIGFVAAITSILGVMAMGVAAHGGNQPSSSPSGPGFTCPDIDRNSQSKIDWMCDKPPHSGSLFGCTYRTGRGTGTYSCVFNTKSGECVAGADHCPAHADSPHHRKRSPDAAPPVPGGHYARRVVH